MTVFAYFHRVVAETVPAYIHINPVEMQIPYVADDSSLDIRYNIRLEILVISRWPT